MAFLDPTVTIAGRLVTLRPISREDYPMLFRWRSSFETVHMLNFRRRVATFEEFVREIEALLPERHVAAGTRVEGRGRRSGTCWPTTLTGC